MGSRGNTKALVSLVHGRQKWSDHCKTCAPYRAKTGMHRINICGNVFTNYGNVTVASHVLQGEGESSLLVLWVAFETGREGGKSLACLSIQAN